MQYSQPPHRPLLLPPSPPPTPPVYTGPSPPCMHGLLLAPSRQADHDTLCRPLPSSMCMHPAPLARPALTRSASTANIQARLPAFRHSHFHRVGACAHMRCVCPAPGGHVSSHAVCPAPGGYVSPHAECPAPGGHVLWTLAWLFGSSGPGFFRAGVFGAALMPCASMPA